MPRPARGRPTEAGAAVSEALRFRLTPDELAGLKVVAAREGVTVSRLLRRAVREMVTGGPDFFDDGTAAMSDVAHELAAMQRMLLEVDDRDDYPQRLGEALRRVTAIVTSTRYGFAAQVRRSRTRWIPQPRRPRPRPTRS